MENENQNEKNISNLSKSKTSKIKKTDALSNGLGKVPPQARSLEEAVLGALMIDKDAVAVVVDILQSDSFYEDRHKSIYKAICMLFEKSHPVDLLTVTEELKKMGALEAVGGAYYLVELTNRIASAANVEFHARIIAQKFIQRELIRVSTDTINEAFEDTTDVFDLLDKAEQGLFSITEKTMSRGVVPMGALMTQALKQIEELGLKEDGLTGVPSGFTNLDRLTSGWQPSDLIIMAARPGMGKTSLTLAIACNAAITFNRPCAFFSLEMSNLQLVNRILSMETQISSEKLRKGKLEEYEWQMLHNQIGRLSNVPIFIDDTPGISVFELRAKCRRLKMQHDIQIIIIDYLQLMTAGGEAGKGGNREQEISQISRSLKGLAKELNVPVIALSQLSRAVEVRGGSKRPQLSDLRECVTADTKIYLPQENQYKTVAELMQSKSDFHVLALDENDLKLKQARCVDIWETGEKEIFEVQTQSGYTIRTSLNHPFKTPDGWTQLVDLKEGDFVGVARQLAHEQQDSELKDDFVKSFEEMQFIANQDTTPEKNSNLSRQRLAKIADILESPNLQKMAQSDLKWDKITKITHIGCEMTYDLHIEEYHNFVANHFVIHNSGAIEQDADIVGFIYRPEYYGILEDEEGNSLKGIGEVIIAKHRNGALDTVRLKWDGQFAKFSNLDDSFGADSQFFDTNSFDGGQIISSKINNEMPPNSMNYSDDVPF